MRAIHILDATLALVCQKCRVLVAGYETDPRGIVRLWEESPCDCVLLGGRDGVPLARAVSSLHASVREKDDWLPIDQEVRLIKEVLDHLFDFGGDILEF